MSRRGLVALVFLAAYLVGLYFLFVNGYARVRGVGDYVSDEVWYVSAAVNVARKVLGLHIVPRTGGGYVVYTVFYDNATCSRDAVLGEVLRLVPGSSLVDREYRRVAAFAIRAPLVAVDYVEALPYRSRCVVDVMPGIAPDNENINSYLNTEHPPLVKYILIGILLARGWDPAAWRAASFVAGAAALLAVVGVAYTVATRCRLRLVHVLLLASIIVAYAARDPSLSSMSSVAMLDIYVAAFTGLAVLAAVRRRYLLASLSAGLAASSKYTGFFVVPAILLAAVLDWEARREWAGRHGLLARLGLSLPVVVAVIPFLVTGLSWLPFAVSQGLGWVLDQVAGAVEWHTTSRPPGPPTTTPLGMLLGRGGFVLYYTPEGKPLLTAVCNPGVCLGGVVVGAASLVAGVAAVYLLRRIRDGVLLAGVGAAPLAVWLGYLAVYAAGNHTLYSFYTVQLSVVAAETLTLIPLLADYSHTLRPRSIGSLLTLPELQPGLSGVAAGVAAAASILASPAWLQGVPPACWAPIYAGLTGSRLERIGLAGVAALLYLAAGLRFAEKKRGLGWLRWLTAGVLAGAGPPAAMAPILFPLANGRPGVLDAVLAGASAPSPLAAGLGAGRIPATRLLAGFLAGFSLASIASAAIVGSASTSCPLWASYAATASALASALLAAAAAPPGLAAGLLVAAAPSAAPLLAITPRGLLYAALAALGVAGGQLWLVRLAGSALAVTALVDFLTARERGVSLS